VASLTLRLDTLSENGNFNRTLFHNKRLCHTNKHAKTTTEKEQKVAAPATAEKMQK